MDSPAPYVQFGFIDISLSNLIVVAVMIVLFAAALLAPFPRERDDLDDMRERKP